MLADGQTFCSDACVELVRAKITGDTPRDEVELEGAAIETKGSLEGGPLVGSAFAHQRPETFVDAPPADTHTPRFPLIFDCDIPAGGMIHVMEYVQFDFVGECARVEPSCADDFDVDLRVGCNMQRVSQTSMMPASMLTEWKRWDMDIARPGTMIGFIVINKSTKPSRFRAVIFGRKIPYASIAPAGSFRG